MQRMTILVTGASGGNGAAVCGRLTARICSIVTTSGDKAGLNNMHGGGFTRAY
jgi:uncharacterized protein YbjT (DUF2867 family)